MKSPVQYVLDQLLRPKHFRPTEGRVICMQCSCYLTFFASVPPIQEFALNLPLMKLLAVSSSIVARIALPSALQPLLACKKQKEIIKKI